MPPVPSDHRKLHLVDADENACVGQRIRGLRKHRKLTLEGLSQLTGISVSSLSRIENTHLSLSISKLRLLADALGIAPEELLRGHKEGDMKTGRPTSPADTGPPVVDRARGREFSKLGAALCHYAFTPSSARALDGIVLEVSAESVWDSEFVRHDGEKVVYIVSGTAILYATNSSPIVLEAGDMAAVDGRCWHSLIATNERECHAIAVYHYGENGSERVFDTRRFTPDEWRALQ